jgi:hypothetical protein
MGSHSAPADSIEGLLFSTLFLTLAQEDQAKSGLIPPPTRNESS